MFRFRSLFFLITFSFLFCGVPTTDLLADSHKSDPFLEFKKNVNLWKLSNGLRVVFLHRDKAPIFSGEIWVKVGGVNEKPGISGIAHMLEHMAFKGTKKIGTKDYSKEKQLLEEEESLENFISKNADIEKSKRLEVVRGELSKLVIDNEFSKIYQNYGASDLNAATSKDYTYYTVELPAVDFELWCWMESDRLLNPVFRQFYKERDVVREERRSRSDDSPEGKVYEALLSTAYLKHPYRMPVIGWAKDLENLTPSMARELHDKYYRPDNIVLSVVGDLDPRKAKKLLEKYFGRIPVSKGEIPKVSIKEPPQTEERVKVVEFDSEPSFAIAFHKETYPSPDDFQFAILHSVLNDGRSSVFYKELVQEKQLALGVYSSEGPGELYPSLFYVAGVPAQGVSNERLRDEVQKILDRFKTELISQEELEAAKRRVEVGLLKELSSNGSLSSTFGHAELLWNNWQMPFEFYEAVEKTTPEDIRNLARKYLNISNRTYIPLERKVGGKK